MRLHNIINGKLRDAQTHRVNGPWEVPTVTNADVALAIKAMRAGPVLQRAAVVEALRRIGKKSAWITHEQCDDLARLYRVPAYHLHEIRRRLNSWLSSIDDYVARVVAMVQPPSQHMRYDGGIATTVVLAGNDFVIAPHLLTHALLAECRLVIKASGADPFTPFLFLRALHEEGITTPQLLYMDSSTEIGRKQVATLLHNTEQSLVIGEDATVAAVYDNASLSAIHRKIPHWTGRSGMVIYDDADIAFAAQCAIEGATFNSGRSCVSTKKLFCSSVVADEFERQLVGEAERLRRRPYDDYYCDIGPQNAEGKALMVGMARSGTLLYDRDLVIARCAPDSPLVTDEYPYPVLAVVRAPDDQLVALANAAVVTTPSHRALNMAVFTASEHRFEAAAGSLASYKVIWNGPTQPFAIYDSHQGLFHFQEMMRVKAIAVGRPSMFELGQPLSRPWPW